MLYFAYGSNMDENQMDRMYPGGFKFISPGKLKNHKITFDCYSKALHSGVIDLVESRGDEIWGVVFDVTEDCARAMDNYEGVEGGMYQRKGCIVETQGGPLEAFLYTVCRKISFQPPSKKYLQKLVQGAKVHNLPKEYIKFLGSIPTLD
jgi:gamma-glutamylcyclotransferase